MNEIVKSLEILSLQLKLIGIEIDYKKIFDL